MYDVPDTCGAPSQAPSLVDVFAHMDLPHQQRFIRLLGQRSALRLRSACKRARDVVDVCMPEAYIRTKPRDDYGDGDGDRGDYWRDGWPSALPGPLCPPDFSSIGLLPNLEELNLAAVVASDDLGRALACLPRLRRLSLRVRGPAAPSLALVAWCPQPGLERVHAVSAAAARKPCQPHEAAYDLRSGELELQQEHGCPALSALVPLLDGLRARARRAHESASETASTSGGGGDGGGAAALTFAVGARRRPCRVRLRGAVAVDAAGLESEEAATWAAEDRVVLEADTLLLDPSLDLSALSRVLAFQSLAFGEVVVRRGDWSWLERSERLRGWLRGLGEAVPVAVAAEVWLCLAEPACVFEQVFTAEFLAGALETWPTLGSVLVALDSRNAATRGSSGYLAGPLRALRARVRRPGDCQGAGPGLQAAGAVADGAEAPAGDGCGRHGWCGVMTTGAGFSAEVVGAVGSGMPEGDGVHVVLGDDPRVGGGQQRVAALVAGAGGPTALDVARLGRMLYANI
ncbi:hypothetical protein GPECTOR_97g769 [Gonium pectorale]|uniref:F-box domain-containing protein n=1 Tax=Gonium pectorale TaxID=33097 RepID=A0A150G083_GONPE|nr:hypothetical protein GPECTOR_97g769 [Gonium pectorale]|eukprot:KXZ43231.1 hypothetical protein GPECTOR_97g769 [Gonium pectorale]